MNENKIRSSIFVFLWNNYSIYKTGKQSMAENIVYKKYGFIP
jgi:hypothetical protein